MAENPFLKKIISAGNLPTDSEDEKLKKSTLLIMAFPFGIAGLMWGGLYFINGLILSGFIPFIYGILSLLSVGHFLITKKFKVFRFSQILLILLLPFFLQISLGGFIPSSTVILWSVISPLGALAFYDIKQSVYWFFAFIVLVLIAFFFNDTIPEYFKWNLSDKFIVRMFAMNIIGISSMIYLIQYYFVGRQTEMKKLIEEKNREVSEKNKEITDSINYAKRIQYALLAHEELLKKNLSDYFILFKPKDIVSGDFYWATEKDGRFYLAVCDSTGHGVPGAFMSLLNISFLNEAIAEKGIVKPNEIFNHVRQRLIENISSDGAKDGMDGILISCKMENGRWQMEYAGANNAPILIHDGKIIELETDNMPVGMSDRKNSFTLFTIPPIGDKGGLLYLYTDGFADQFGGPKGKKFKYKPFNEKLASISNQPLKEQKRILEKTFEDWKGNLEQVDDVLIVGIKI
jgi:serine phosphatase RsbU (regulator of sigma subunit)